MKIGVLGLQGAVQEHVKSIEACGEEAVIVKYKEQLEEIDGLILPGGESTAMRRMIDQDDLLDHLKEFVTFGKPLFGTCAGLILLAKKIFNDEQCHIGALDVIVERNSFGRQRESFEATLDIAHIAEDYRAVFIRAPHIVQAGENVEVLAKYNGRIVMVREGNLLGCSFHPELTADHRITAYFIKMVKEAFEQQVE